MRKGFVFGKFMPLHRGHLALIDFARGLCDHLAILVCYTENEPVPGPLRTQWIKEELTSYTGVVVIPFLYNENELPNTSESSLAVSEVWATAFRKIVPEAGMLFTSEPYGDHVAGCMKIKHVLFDNSRLNVPVSASQIRAFPFRYWDFIATAAKPFFVKKIVLVGSESTGKTTLAEKLAAHYNTVFVPEMAREIIERTEECTYDDLSGIAALHAATLLEKLPNANKLLFADTDVLITKSYSRFLFNRELAVDPWIEEANKFDLYLFLETDCEYVQDGTRLAREERNRLSENHKLFFREAAVPLVYIRGDWKDRFEMAVRTIDRQFFQ